MKKTVCMLCSILLLLSMTLGLAGCGAQTQKPIDLTQDVTAQTPDGTAVLPPSDAQLTDFALRLFRAGQTEGESSLISPLSVLYALAMTANGAQGETREQMESVLGMKVEDLNEYLLAYRKGLQKDRENVLDLANSIWFKEDFEADRNFLQTNADYYGSELYKTPFDSGTADAINDWVNEKTHGMIPKILDRVPSDAIMYLVNALAFEAKWAKVYDEYQVMEDEFTREDGQKKTVDFMHSTEKYYLETANATGFMKYYTGGHYAFTALLPNEGVSVAELVGALDGSELHNLLAHPQTEYDVIASIPKFESRSSMELSDVLKTMGMPLAFDEDRADFTAMGNIDYGNIYISRVLHKTFISVAEQGTRAGAATVVEMARATSAGPGFEPEPKVVELDRPFVYMLVDLETGTPFFIGTMMDPTI